MADSRAYGAALLKLYARTATPGASDNVRDTVLARLTNAAEVARQYLMAGLLLEGLTVEQARAELDEIARLAHKAARAMPVPPARRNKARNNTR